MGLSTAPPEEFVCPLTLDLMADPVVASDGHSYERAAIVDVLNGPNKKSPLTREVLTANLLPNRALRRRIEEHERELDQLAEQLEARMQQTAEEAAKTAEEAAATARAEGEAAARAEAEEAAAAARAEAEALRQQLEEYKAAAKRAAPEGEAAAEPRASKRRR